MCVHTYTHRVPLKSSSVWETDFGPIPVTILERGSVTFCANG